jgi:hypothetical protein
MLDIDIYRSLALAYESYGNLEAASRTAQKAIEDLEQLQRGIFREDARIGYSEPSSALYEIVVRDCIHKNELRGAIEWMERARSRILVARLAKESALLPTTDDAPKELLKKEARLLTREQNLSRELAGRIGSDDRSVQNRILDLQQQLEEVWQHLEEYDPLYVAKRRGQPLAWSGMRNLLLKQPFRSGAIEFFVHQDSLVALLLLPDENQPRSIIRSFPKRRLESLWQDRWWSLRWKKNLNALVDPLSRYLERLDLLYIVPHNLLHGIPLHAGKVQGDVLLKHTAVAYIPSLTALSYLRPHGELQTCLAFGYSRSEKDKEGFENEAQSVAQYFQTRATTGFRATCQKFMRQQRGKDILHIACHGEFDEEDPLNSRLILADGNLTPRQLMQERLDANLAMIPACHALRSDSQGIDETLGFARALFYAGISTVIAPSKIIDPDAAQVLVEKFYENLIQHQMQPAFALRAAQLDLLSNPSYRIEEYWAPLMLMGIGANHN